MEANEEKNEIKYGVQHHIDYLSAQVFKILFTLMKVWIQWT